MKKTEQKAAILTLELFNSILPGNPDKRRSGLAHMITKKRAMARVDPDSILWVVSTEDELADLLETEDFKTRYDMFKEMAGLANEIFWDLPVEIDEHKDSENNISVSPYKIFAMLTRESVHDRKWDVDEMLADSHWLKEKPHNITVFPDMKVIEVSESWLRELQDADPFDLRFEMFDRWISQEFLKE